MTKGISMMRLTTQNVALLSDDDIDENAPKLTPKQHIINRRGAFKWLPVYCTTDVAHGSWWFVWGSLLAMFMSIIPLIQVDVNIFQATDDTLPVLDFYSTWALLIVSGFFFTVGSYAFVRAFEEPPKPPLFTWKHFETDELLGAWLFFFGTAPAVPYTAIFYILNPEEILYLGGLAAAVVFVLATLLFVFACYPSEKKHRQIIKPLARICFGPHHSIIKHIQNDWLAGTWFFLYASALSTLASLVVLVYSCRDANQLEIFIYTCSLIDMFLFTVGSAYFVAGSYPMDHYKCYKAKRFSHLHEIKPFTHADIDMQTGDIDEL
mmetsp:Transcript_964/g.964  ORF Transcript_964/g.964 Transcript_964/m.964 type:complete len:321 (-) Transcript_964:227-1189(-)